ncbi:hypothetical protein V5O48_003166 [Marasmius crinis-equi]|uniref:Mediator of RNA polymerase II transcription subunit 9 n=1 Tax=Marasmius crinis-equi TaxID=585013 RepID=A0ABR3FTN6_9AGAR
MSTQASIPGMTTNPLPTTLFQSLLSKLATILELTQTPDGTSTPQGREAIRQATDDFRRSLANAKSLAGGLPGGELLIEDQDDVIDMLVTLRDRKREQLADFSNRASAASSTARESIAELKMEVDSMASTPFHET